MYQPNAGNYAGEGATKMARPGAGAMGGGGMNNMNGSFGGSAYSGYGSGYGAGGYGGAAGYGGYGGAVGYGGGSMYGNGMAPGQGGAPGSMYGGGSMYGQMGAGSMMENAEGPIVVTKIFSSRRDLDHLASAKDFGRRFDSNWGSYRTGGADGYGGSMYGTNSAAGGSLMNFGDKPGGSSMMDRGVGAAGMGPDGDSLGKKPAAATAAEKQPSAGAQAATEKSKSNDDASSKRGPASRGVPAPASAEPSKAPAKPTSPSKEQQQQQQKQQQAAEKAAKDAAAAAAEKAAKDAAAAAAEKAAKDAAAAAAEKAKAEKAAKDAAAAAAAAEKAKEAAKSLSAKEAKPREQDPLDDIPLLAEDVRPKPKPATPAAATAAAEPKKAPTPATEKAREAPAKEAPKEASLTREGDEAATGRHPRPRSRPAARPVSRITSMNVVDFPEAEEVKDEVGAGGLHDAEKEARDAAARAEMRREREAAVRAAREERQRQRQVVEDAQKEREEEARKRRQDKDDEERQRKEVVAKMDEERKRERDAAVAARERQREEEKRRFEEAKRAEEEKEAARAAALLAERQRQLEAQDKEAQEKPARSASRPRSRRPASRPASGLRGAIPEQPPDVVGGQIKDTLAADTIGKPSHSQADGAAAEAGQRAAQAHRERASPVEGRHGKAGSPPSGARRPPPTPSETVAPVPASVAAEAGSSRGPESTAQKSQPTPAEVVVTAAGPKSTASPRTTPATGSAHASPQSQASKGSQPKDDKSASSAEKSSSQRVPNMVKTLVLVEEVRNSNHALVVGDKTITYKDQTLAVTEVKTRPEDNFNYHSGVVHDVREAVCNGYNAAVLAVDAPNTAGRFDSPVWSILNRIVRTLLQDNAAEGGGVRPDFELTCAMGYLYKDKVKDLLVSPGTDAPFTKIGVNPSPIYGPRLTNLNYDAVSDAAMFEDVLSSTLSHASDDATVHSLSEGVVAAFVLVKQTRETDGKPDIYLSSLIVASAGDDTFPYQSALSHTRNEYATVFHLVLGGPSCTCFMLNIADDDSIRKAGSTERESVPDGLERVLTLLQSMSGLQNYDLRSGSVKRFIRYVEMSHTNAQTRLEREEDEGQRRKVERYLREQERLLQDAYRLLEEAHISYKNEM